jgi:hypothetical protein
MPRTTVNTMKHRRRETAQPTYTTPIATATITIHKCQRMKNVSIELYYVTLAVARLSEINLRFIEA